MQPIGQGSGDLHEQTKRAMGGGDTMQHGFFTPLNALDPHQKGPKKELHPKFEFRVFCLSGLEYTPQEGADYRKVMNKIASAEYQQLEEKTFHTVDGGIKVLLKWLEMPTQEEISAHFDDKLGMSDKPKSKKKKSKKKSKPAKVVVKDTGESLL